MEAWIEPLLDDRSCMDCEAPIEGFKGAMVFPGRQESGGAEDHQQRLQWPHNHRGEHIREQVFVQS
jgi:hypothetical protein